MIGEQDIEYDIEQLSAFLDGELPQKEMKQVRTRLLVDKDYRARHDAMKADGNLLLAFSAQIDSKPLPESLRVMVAPALPPRRAYGFFAAAAVVLMLVGGFSLTQNPSPEYAWLDQLRSGNTLTLPEGSVEVIASFRHRDGNLCREAATDSKRAVFCRIDGNWQLMIEADRAGSPAGMYVPAGENGVDSIDEFIRVGMDGMVLGPAEEKSLIDSGWSTD